MDFNEIPMGLSMALGQNPEAMKKFCSLSDEEQKQIIEKTHSITSKQEMKSFVSNTLK